MAGIATGLIIAGLSAGMSFGQAAKQNKLRKKAEAEADRKMALAHKSLEKNNMESLSIPMEAYKAQNEAIVVAGSIAMDAAREGAQRGVGTVAQNVLNFEQDKLRETSIRQGQDLFNLAAATAEQEQSNQDKRAGLYMQEAEGAQMAAADAAEARNAAIQAGIGSVTDMAQTGLEAGALYKNDKGMQKAALQSQFDDTRAKGLSIAKDSDFLIDPSAYGRGKDFGEGFKPRDYRKAKRRYDFTNPDYNRRYAAGIESFYNSNSGFLDQ